eukprot:9082119-Alexandrium_andersonii.AAC.1
MSASLVGSEMCIRDRKPGMRETVGNGGKRRTGWERLETVANGGSSWKPVSYTHLTLPTICSV